MRTTALILLVLPACQGGKDLSARTASLTCDQKEVLVDGTRIDQCMEFKVEPQRSGEAASACQSVNGSVRYDPCRTVGAVGKCSNIDMGSISATIYFFHDQLVDSVAGGRAKCGNLGGQFETVGPITGDESTKDVVVCTSIYDTGFCMEWPDVYNSGRRKEITSFCDLTDRTIRDTPCQRTGAYGYCLSTDGPRGDLREWWSAPEDPDFRAVECESNGGSWVTAQ